LWFLTKNKKNGKFSNREGKTLFIDARKLGVLIDRVHRDLMGEEISRIAEIYHAWRGEKGAGKYEDVAGFCKSASVDDFKQHTYVLTPGRYVGAEDLEDESEPFEQKIKRLAATLEDQFAASHKLEQIIRTSMRGIRRLS
jgi:type I restriction enzyme M protein